MAASEHTDRLTANETLRLAEFARACKAAARVVALYPATHPAIRSALARTADAGRRLRGEGVAVLSILPDGMHLDGRAPAKPDPSLSELAELLHAHKIGELRLTGDLEPAAWHTLLSLVARPPEDVRADGGITRAWADAGGDAIDIREIDYEEVLRHGASRNAADWERILADYLSGEPDALDAAVASLYELAGDSEQFFAFAGQLVTQAEADSSGSRKEVVLRLFAALANFVAAHHPDQLSRILGQVAGVVPQLTPEMVLSLLSATASPGDAAERGIDLSGEVRARLTDEIIASFVARSVAREQSASVRLAEAFQALVPDEDRRGRLLERAGTEARDLGVGGANFEAMWKNAAELITTYSDSAYVSEEYGRELATARAHALDVERVSDDPPERIAEWLSTIDLAAVRRAEQQVLLDLLAIERRPAAWGEVLESALETIERLVLAGQVPMAREVLEVLAKTAEGDEAFAEAARKGLATLRQGPVAQHVVRAIHQAESDADVEAVTAFCRALGPSLVRPLVEALAGAQGVAVKRLRDVLLSFGAAGRPYADELRTSASPSVRRMAVELLRAYGGAEALPDLAALLDDAEPSVQREALRAIVQIGNDEAYATLDRALKSGGVRTREAIMQALGAARDERAAPLFIHILEHTDHRGPLASVHLAAISALGKLGGDAAVVSALARILHRGDWWAPLRTRRLRAAAAAALAAAGSAGALRALEDAAANGPPGTRRAARAALAAAAPSTSAGSRTA